MDTSFRLQEGNYGKDGRFGVDCSQPSIFSCFFFQSMSVR